MSRRLPFRVLLAITLPLLAGIAVSADEVVLRSGESLQGEVLSLDEETLLIRLVDGEREFVSRERVDRIILAPPAEVPPISVEVKNLGSDDALDLWVNDEKVLEGSRVSREWIDVTERLRDGSNEFRVVVLNERETWAYRWALRLQGKATTFECGIPARAGCTEEGREGDERGEIELPSVWVFVDRDEGRVEIDR
jgi:hypothetical protein